MKKVLAIVLAALMVLSLAACSTNSGDNKDESKPVESTSAEVKDLDIDMSKYPSDLSKWTSKDLIDYFKDAGVFKDGDGFEIWEQEHQIYWDNAPVNGAVGCWDDTSVSIMIAILGADNADTSEEQLNEWKAHIKEKKAFPGDYSTFTVDHLVGNLAFEFETTIADDDIYNAMTDAYNYLVKSMNVTPEF